MKRRFSNMLMVALAVTIGLASLGVGYGLWSKSLTISGTVSTGSIELAFVSNTSSPPITPYTDDDNQVDDPAVDPTDIGSCNIGVGDDDGDGHFDEDPPGDKNLDGYPGKWGIDDDGDLLVDEDSQGRQPGEPGYTNDLWADDDEDGLVDEDPAGSITTTCDPRSLSAWVTTTQSWLHTPTTDGPDRGTTITFVDGDTLQVFMAKPSVRPDGGYSPTVYFEVTNHGNVPIIVTDVSVTLPYELWDTNADGSIVDGGPNIGDCDPGDECAPAVDARLTGLVEGVTEVYPSTPVQGTLELFMTPATNPGEIYAVYVGITGHNYNEP